MAGTLRMFDSLLERMSGRPIHFIIGRQKKFKKKNVGILNQKMSHKTVLDQKNKRHISQTFCYFEQWVKLSKNHEKRVKKAATACATRS